MPSEGKSITKTKIIEEPKCFYDEMKITSSSSTSVGATARCGLWPVEQYLSIYPCPSPTLSIFSLPTL
jgi:hypothetical protein